MNPVSVSAPTPLRVRGESGVIGKHVNREEIREIVK
jgi:hypothetical protein